MAWSGPPLDQLPGEVNAMLGLEEPEEGIDTLEAIVLCEQRDLFLVEETIRPQSGAVDRALEGVENHRPALRIDDDRDRDGAERRLANPTRLEARAGVERKPVAIFERTFPPAANRVSFGSVLNERRELLLETEGTKKRQRQLALINSAGGCCGQQALLLALRSNEC